MDIRILRYYLAVVREGNISAAAESLHISQPALSRQIRDLEEELGVNLFVRGSRRIMMTEEGLIFRKRAEEILHLMQQTEKELSEVGSKISGDIYIGAGESFVFHYLSRVAGKLQEDYPDIRYHVVSGDTRDLMEQLEHGLLDFALIFTDYDQTIYQSLPLPEADTFGVLMRKDSPLASKNILMLQDLDGQPVLVSRASLPFVTGNPQFSSLHIAATYNLIYNASLLVEDGLGYALCFDKLINTAGSSTLTFRPLSPSIAQQGVVIWKKYIAQSPAVRLFLETLRAESG